MNKHSLGSALGLPHIDGDQSSPQRIPVFNEHGHFQQPKEHSIHFVACAENHSLLLSSKLNEL